MSADIFAKYWLSFCEETPQKVSLASMKSINNSQSRNLLQGALSGFPIAACDSENSSVPKAGH
jgi:hypothetical protein